MAENFHDHAREAAADFLQTVMVIDDQAEIQADEPVLPLAEPGFESALQPDKPLAPAQRPKGALNAGLLAEAFSKHGLLCGIFRPTGPDVDDDLREGALGPATRADIVVLDWVLNDDGGVSALNFIESLVKKDDPSGTGRLRLIAIYTSERDLAGIAETIRNRLDSFIEGCSEPTIDRGVWLTSKGLRIVVLAKEDVPLPEETLASKATLDELPDALIDNFVQMTDGIMPTFALRCLTIIRENAHHVLRKFNVRLDPPFISHRSFTQPIDAEDFATGLIGGELLSLLDAAEVSQAVSTPIVEMWIKDRVQDDSYDIGSGVSLERSHLIAILANINAELDGAASSARNRLRKAGTITRAFIDSDEAAISLDHELARLSCLARNGPEPFINPVLPTLTLGTILKSQIVVSEDNDNVDWAYWLSVQPSCDAVRLEEPRAFPLMPLKSVPLNERFEIAALDTNGETINLSSKAKLFEIKSVLFAPGPDGRVRAQKSGREYVLRDEQKSSFVWIGQLRPFHAQKFANVLAGDVGRQGLDEYEWLRRKH